MLPLIRLLLLDCSLLEEDEDDDDVSAGLLFACALGFARNGIRGLLVREAPNKLGL